MTHRVILRKEAQDQRDDAAVWYEDQRRDLGDEVLDEAASTLTRIGNTPFAYAEVHRRVRSALLRRFPFALYFRVDSEVVSVLAVMLGSRSPTAWRIRE